MISINIDDFSLVIVIHLECIADFQKLKKIDTILENHSDESRLIIALDFRKLQSIDSLSIGALAQFAKITADQNIRLIAYELMQPIERLFNISGLHKFFEITTEKKFEAEYNINLTDIRS